MCLTADVIVEPTIDLILVFIADHTSTNNRSTVNYTVILNTFLPYELNYLLSSYRLHLLTDKKYMVM